MQKIAVIGVAALAIIASLAIYNSESSFVFTQSQEIPFEIHRAFEKWQSEHRKSYNSPAEKNYRLQVFYLNSLKITAENEMKRGYTFGHNKFSDLTQEEFITKYGGFKF